MSVTTAKSTDASAIRDFYLAMCEQRGLPRPDVIGL